MVTLGRAQSRDYPKPICRFCYAPCDPRTREYRGMQACPDCYNEYADTSYTVVHKRRPDGDVSKRTD